MPAMRTTVKLERREARRRNQRAAMLIFGSAFVAFLFVRGGGSRSRDSTDALDGGSGTRGSAPLLFGSGSRSRKGGSSVAWGGGDSGWGGSRSRAMGTGVTINREEDAAGGDSLRRSLRDVSFGSPVRVFVYTPRDVPEIGKLAPERGCKATREEQLIHALLLQHPTLRAKHPDDANIFFVPSYPECLAHDAGVSPAKYSALIVAALGRMPAFRRSGGLDHVLMAPPRGMRSVFPAWRRHCSNCLFFTPEPVAGNGYGGDVFREMVLPGAVTRPQVGGGGGGGGSGGGGGGGEVDNEVEADAAGGVGSSSKKRLLTVLGDGSGAKELRAALLDGATGSGDGGGGGGGGGEGDAVTVFCVVAVGDRGWSAHLAVAIWRGCIPVVVIPDDDKHAPRLPLEDVIDYSSFSLRVPHSVAVGGHSGAGAEGGSGRSAEGGSGSGAEEGGIIASLHGVDWVRRRRLVRGVAAVRCAFVYPGGSGSGSGGGGGGGGGEGGDCSAVAAVEAQIARRVLAFPRTTGSFWNHHGTVMDSSRVPYSAWGERAPFPTEDIYTYAPKGNNLDMEC